VETTIAPQTRPSHDDRDSDRGTDPGATDRVHDLAFQPRVIVDAGRLAILTHELEDVRAFERPPLAHREQRTFRREAGALGCRAVEFVPRDADERDVDDAGDLLGHNGEQVLRPDALRHEGRNAVQRAQLVMGHLQLGGPLGHLHLERVASLAELFFCPFPLVDEACALERSGSVVRSEG